MFSIELKLTNLWSKFHFFDKILDDVEKLVN